MKKRGVVIFDDILWVVRVISSTDSIYAVIQGSLLSVYGAYWALECLSYVIPWKHRNASIRRWDIMTTSILYKKPGVLRLSSLRETIVPWLFFSSWFRTTGRDQYSRKLICKWREKFTSLDGLNERDKFFKFFFQIIHCVRGCWEYSRFFPSFTKCQRWIKGSN